MTGEHLDDVLSGLLDGELTPAEEAAARAHLARCADCAAELEAVAAVRLTVRALPRVEPPFGFFERMFLAGGPLGSDHAGRPAGGERGGPLFWRDRRRAVGAALAAGAAASVLLLGASPTPKPPVSPSVARMIEAHATSASVSGDVLSTLTPAGVPVSFGP